MPGYQSKTTYSKAEAEASPQNEMGLTSAPRIRLSAAPDFRGKKWYLLAKKAFLHVTGSKGPLYLVDRFINFNSLRPENVGELSSCRRVSSKNTMTQE